MFCIALVLLLQCLFFGSSGGYTFRVGGSDFVQLDLFDTLHLHNSTYQGITLGIGVHTLSPGVIFTGDYREIMISGSWIDRIRSELGKIGANEFTISTIIKQNPNNVGTLLAFSRGLLSALEIQSSGRKNELRVISGSSVETFPFRLADGNWHRLAIAFSASQVDILVDCTLTYRRVLKFDPAAAISNSHNISIWIGQKTTSHFLYQGVMQDLRLTFGPYGYLAQCPQMDSQCPTCSEFTALKMSFASLQSQIQLLTERLIRAEARLTNVEQCDCQKSCRVNVTTVVDDGSSWQQDCDICACKKGEIKCRPVQCPLVRCKNPIIKPGECCPTCLNQCFFRGKSYDHGETEAMPECAYCECMDGSMQCKKGDSKNCPPLSCPPSEQIVVPGECCKVCPGTDYCATEGHRCHSNATCVNLRTTFTCQCKEGFSGDGLTCEDMDECLLERNHCARNTRCVNTLGGYACECFNGFKKINAFQCEDQDECAPGFPNDCSPHATCTNTKGSYTCACSPGYTGSGYGAAGCTPICNSTCENGGICIAPDVCSCRSGWTGSSCETDTDECLLMGRNISSAGMGSVCPENAICVNKPGWYLCQCKDGFQANLAENGQARCQDINECEFSPCSNGLECVNTLGSYECQCPEGSADCSPGCFLKGKMQNLGSSWFSEDCSNTCTCSSPNNITCQEWSQADCSLLCSLNNNDDSKNNNDHDVNNNNNDDNNNVSNINKQCCSHCTNNIKNNNNKYINSTTTTTVPIGMSLMKKTKKKKTCRHQLYPDTHHQSGEMWHYQCQTCECLDGEIDCWPIDCPPVNCHNAFLPEGDCCYRCPEEESDGDKCTHWHANNTECQLIQNTIDTIESGTRVTMPHHHCISCKCQVPLCAKSVSKNDGFCVLRMEISVVLMTMTVWFAVNVLLPS